jgi:TPR repeat protein
VEDRQLTGPAKRPRFQRIAAWLLFVGGLLLMLTVTTPAGADFDGAVKAYDAGDYAAAFKEWARLAEQGDMAAMRNIGHLYRFGKGTEKNLTKAAEWYRRAAEGGLDRAQANLAALYLSGDGVPQSYADAAKWFERAARQGLAIAQYNLGLLYEHGLGVEQSDPKALGWYNLAAKAGEPHALERLSALVQKAAPSTLDIPSTEPAKPSTPAPAPTTIAAPSPSPTEAGKPDSKEEGGLFGFLGDIFGDHSEASSRPGTASAINPKAGQPTGDDPAAPLQSRHP